jgi:tRNA(adenine34) deaminase
MTNESENQMKYPETVRRMPAGLPLAPESEEGRMALAMEEARLGAEANEVPVGAILVAPGGELLATAHDERMALADPTAHAEILAMRRAAQLLGDWRLDGCDLYVTLEPCPMCAGALVLARVRRVVYGATSPKSGAVETLTRLLDVEVFNHRVEAQGGLKAEECGGILSAYFQSRRNKT